MELKEKLMRAAKHYSGAHYSENSIELTSDQREYYLDLGKVEEDGYQIMINVWDDGQINRIIMTSGKIPELDNQSTYVETREQEVLDSFANFLVCGEGTFNSWVGEAMERLEDKLERMYKIQREKRKAEKRGGK